MTGAAAGARHYEQHRERILATRRGKRAAERAKKRRVAMKALAAKHSAPASEPGPAGEAP